MAIPVGGTAPAAAPNVDRSVIEYFIGGRRLHINLYHAKLGNLTSTGTPPQPDYDYDDSGTFAGFTVIGTETTLQNTLTAFLTPVKKLYDNTVNFSIKSTWKRDGTSHQLVETFPTAGLGAELGTGGSESPAVVTPTSDDEGCFIEHILTTRTGHGGRFVVKFVGAAPATLGKPTPIAPNASGNPYEQLVAYLTSPECRIQGHAGGKLLPQFVLHRTPSAKLRRSFKWA